MLKKSWLLLLILVAVGCTQKAKDEPRFLYVILSDHGEIQKGIDGKFKLILDHGRIEKVLLFSDRPYRIVRHINAERFRSLWSNRPKSFKEDPPNATVIINQQLQTIILEDIKVEGTKTIFTIRADGLKGLDEVSGKVQMSGKTELFIDTFATETTCQVITC